MPAESTMPTAGRRAIVWDHAWACCCDSLTGGTVTSISASSYSSSGPQNAIHAQLSAAIGPPEGPAAPS